jgi:hypothetical protein
VNGNSGPARYWKNGIVQNLADSTHKGYANAIAVSGNDVYVVGYLSNSAHPDAVLWKNGVLVPLTDGTRYSLAYAVAISGNDVYVAGVEYNAQNVVVAKYWKNGAGIDLTDGTRSASANAIVLSGSDIYIAGREWNGSVYEVKYWKNTYPVIIENRINGLPVGIAVGAGQ